MLAIFRRLFGLGASRSARAGSKVTQKASNIARSDNMAKATAAATVTPYAGEEGKPLPVRNGKSGFYFKDFSPESPDQVGSQNFDFNVAQIYEQDLLKFYNSDVQLFSDPSIFYEEMEQDFVRRRLPQEEQYFRNLDKFRRVINDNVRAWFVKMPLLAGAALAGAQLLAYLFLRDGQTLLAIGSLSLSTGPALIFLLSALWTVSFFIFKAGFIIKQQDTAQKLNNELQERLGRIDSCLQKAVSNAQRTEETLSQEEEEKAPQRGATWVLAFHWLAMKTMFMERYLRNILYQTKRNGAWYVQGGTAIALIAAMINAALPFAYLGRSEAILLSIGLTLMALVRFAVRGRRDPFEIIKSRLAVDSWQRFHRMDIWESLRKMTVWDKDKILDLKYQRFRGGRGPTGG